MLPEVFFLSLLVFLVGAIGFVTRKSALTAFMCFELMMNAAGIALAAFSNVHASIDAQLFVFFVMLVAVAETAVGLGIILALFRTTQSHETDAASEMKG